MFFAEGASFTASKNPRKLVQTHSRSSILGLAINSPSFPQKLPFSLLYKKRSALTMSFWLTPAKEAISFMNGSESSPSLPLAASCVSPQKIGRSSFCTLNLWPSFASRFMWIARFGIISRSLSAFTRCCLRVIFLPSSPALQIILPATERGLSNHGAQSIPPYFSTFSFMYFPSDFMQGFSFILNEGESLWLAVSIKPSKSFEGGSAKDIMEDEFLATKYFPPHSSFHSFPSSSFTKDSFKSSSSRFFITWKGEGLFSINPRSSLAAL